MTLVSCDTNILLHAINSNSPHHKSARELLAEWSSSKSFRICELVLIELYVLLRNPAVLEKPMSAMGAVEVCRRLRSNPNWGLLDYPGPLAGIMARTWDCAQGVQFARRRIFDARLAFTLQHHGITHFYTQNLKDFRDLGFQSVVDPFA